MTIGKMISEVSFTDKEKEAIKDTYMLLHILHDKMPSDAIINSDHYTHNSFYDWEELNLCMDFLDDLFSGIITIEYKFKD